MSIPPLQAVAPVSVAAEGNTGVHALSIALIPHHVCVERCTLMCVAPLSGSVQHTLHQRRSPARLPQADNYVMHTVPSTDLHAKNFCITFILKF